MPSDLFGAFFEKKNSVGSGGAFLMCRLLRGVG
jgi:hypothetical protein